jgi:hypothetical protein
MFCDGKKKRLFGMRGAFYSKNIVGLLTECFLEQEGCHEDE